MRGHPQKPRWVRIASLALWGVALSMPLQVWWWFGTPPWEWPDWWAQLTVQNRVVMVGGGVAAVGIGRVVPWGWWAAAGFLAAAVLNNLILLPFETPVPKVAVVVATSAALGAVGWLARPETAKLFRETGLHWWKTPRRYPVSVPVTLGTGEQARSGRTANLSRTGVFVATGAEGLRPGQRVAITVDLGRRVIEGVAEVVRCVGGECSAAQGVGLRFARVPVTDRLWLRARLGCVRR